MLYIIIFPIYAVIEVINWPLLKILNLQICKGVRNRPHVADRHGRNPKPSFVVISFKVSYQEIGLQESRSLRMLRPTQFCQEIQNLFWTGFLIKEKEVCNPQL